MAENARDVLIKAIDNAMVDQPTKGDVALAVDEALAALDAAGLAVVPKVPTEAMITALQEWAICSGYIGKGYDAMLAAARTYDGHSSARQTRIPPPWVPFYA